MQKATGKQKVCMLIEYQIGQATDYYFWQLALYNFTICLTLKNKKLDKKI